MGHHQFLPAEEIINRPFFDILKFSMTASLGGHKKEKENGKILEN